MHSPLDFYTPIFRELIDIEGMSDQQYRILTTVENAILAHRPTSTTEAVQVHDVIRVRYGEQEDAPLHRAIEAIIQWVDELVICQPQVAQPNL